ncbi:MAG: DUF2158 domain-containing protein [SAR324 cluster bacterium]|nr:DUF2158 domain-containing protein [SAR324 cluster bacterium]
MSEQIKEGDVVQLKSGGPKMTVGEGGYENNGFRCHWFDGSNPMDGIYAASSLEKYDKPRGI